MLEFEKQNEKEYEVTVNGDNAGSLIFDQDQDAWVFDWGEEGVTYESSLEDTMEELRDEFKEGKDDENFTRFGNYQY